MNCKLILPVLAAFLALGGCVHAPLTQPLAAPPPSTGGYRLSTLEPKGNSDEVFIVLAFSGGGTRAAALSYGVLKGLAASTILVDGQTKRLLDEVDMVSTVSGGSFTGAYWALFGDKVFTDFEGCFLKRDLVMDLAFSVWGPINRFRIWSPYFDRIDVAAELYGDTIFLNKSFQDLIAKKTKPYLMLNATNIQSGQRFGFVQEEFDMIGSDLAAYPIGRAVAASSAFPGLLSPVALKNHPPAVPAPEWVLEWGQQWDRDRYHWLAAKQWNSYNDKQTHPYLHLVDGGLADNTGLRPVLALIKDSNSADSIRSLVRDGKVRKLVVIAVNAGTDAKDASDLKEDSPNIADVLFKTTTTSMDNFSFESVELARNLVDIGMNTTPEQRQCKAPVVRKVMQRHQKLVDYYFVDVNLQALADDSLRKRLLSVPTTFSLPAGDVDALVQAGQSLLNESMEFKCVLEDLNLVDGQ
jgi:NTE family protein